jgi:hypothetical protein
VVEVPATSGWLCLFQPWKNWQGSRKANPVGGKPIFTWGDGSLVMLDNIKRILTVLLPGLNPRITTQASILAHEGASEGMLKALGLCTSKTYLHYVREGRTGDWRGLLQKLRDLSL